jgi:hypothetical protein
MFKIDKIVSGGLYCQSDNKQVFPLDGLTNISIGEPCDIDKEEFRIPAEISVDVATINREALSLLCNPVSTRGFSIEFDMPVGRVQVKRHRQKRINKKWAKKYGYRTVMAPFSGNVDSMTDNRDGTISFEIGKFVKKEGQC